MSMPPSQAPMLQNANIEVGLDYGLDYGLKFGLIRSSMLRLFPTNRSYVCVPFLAQYNGTSSTLPLMAYVYLPALSYLLECMYPFNQMWHRTVLADVMCAKIG